MKRLIFAFAALVATMAFADEGMWMPQQVPQLASELQKMGIKIDPQRFADLTGDPMGAVISLGGCSASFVSPDELASGSDIIRAAARDAGRSIDEDHYGTTIFVAETGEDAAALAPRLHALRRDVPTAETVATGTAAARDLLERFVAAGASKFVVIPVARDPTAFLGTLRDEVVASVES